MWRQKSSSTGSLTCSGRTGGRSRSRPAGAGTGRLVRLSDGELGVDQGKHTLGGRQPALDLAPEGREVLDRGPEAVEAVDEQVPGADGDQALGDGQAAGVDEQRRPAAGQSVQRGEDQRQSQPAPDVDAIGLSVDLVELGVDGRLPGGSSWPRRCR